MLPDHISLRALMMFVSFDIIRQRIDNYHGLRKNLVRNGANLGRRKSYFDDKLEEYRKQLIDNLMIHEKKYQINTNVEKHGHEYGIDPTTLEMFSGNKAQHRFHKRILESLDRSFSIPTSDIKTLSIGSLKCAYAANRVRKNSLTESCLNFANSLLYLAKRAGGGIAKGGIDFSRAVVYLLGDGEIPSDTSSISEIFAKIKEQPLEGVGDGLEYAVRTLTFGSAVFVSYLLGLEVAAVGVGAAKGLVEATKFLEPFSVGISPSGVATLEYSFASAKDFAKAGTVVLGQAAQSIYGIAEQCGHLFAAGSGGGPGSGDIKVSWITGNGKSIWFKENGKIAKQIRNRMWSKKDIDNVISNPIKKFKTIDERWTKIDGKSVKVNQGSATVSFKSNYEYVVINDTTGEIIQISNKLKTNWAPNWDLWKEI